MIELKNVSKSFDDKKVLDSFSAVFEDGMYLLKGPSGIGKTTCIRLILGLLEPDEGEIKKPDNMRFSVCFQENRLFEKETVLTNILAVNEGVSVTDATSFRDIRAPPFRFAEQKSRRIVRRHEETSRCNKSDAS